MATGDPPLQTRAVAEYNGTYVAGNATATGPYLGSVDWGGATDTTISFPSPTGISFPEIKVAGEWMKNPPKPPIIEPIGKAFRDLAAAFGANMAKELDDLIMNGPKPRKKEKKKMPKNDERTLYNVFVIDPEGDGDVVATLKNVVAKNAGAAEKKAVFELASNARTAEKLKKDLEEYDFLVEDVADFGAIRPKTVK